MSQVLGLLRTLEDAGVLILIQHAAYSKLRVWHLPQRCKVLQRQHMVLITVFSIVHLACNHLIKVNPLVSVPEKQLKVFHNLFLLLTKAIVNFLSDQVAQGRTYISFRQASF